MGTLCQNKLYSLLSFLPQAESQDFLAKSSSNECGSLSSLPKTVLWKRFNKQLTAGGRDWEERGGPSGSPRCEGLSHIYIYTHKTCFIAMLKVFTLQKH